MVRIIDMKLFRPAWDSYNEKRAVKAVKKLKSEAKLVHVAKKAQCSLAREAAIEKLTDQTKIAEIAQSDEVDFYIKVMAADLLVDRFFADKIYAEIVILPNFNGFGNGDSVIIYLDVVKKITEQTVLADVACKAKTLEFCKAAVEKLTDQTLLAMVGTTANYFEIRLVVAKKTTDFTVAQTIFMDIAQNGKADFYTRVKATDLLVNRFFADKIYAEIVILYSFEYIEEMSCPDIVKKITEQTALADVACKAKTFRLCQAALEKLTDQTLLAIVGTTANDITIRFTAAKKITNSALAQTIFTDIAQGPPNYYNGKKTRVEVADFLVDRFLANKIYAEEVIECSGYWREKTIGLDTVKKITEQAVLADVVFKAKTFEICQAAFEKLTDLYDLKEDLLMDLIRLLGSNLENSSNGKEIRVWAANALKTFYQQYGKSELGKVIRLYEGTYTGGECIYSDYKDHPESDEFIVYEDTSYSFNVKFDMEESS